jgi:hypothetical protein
MKTRGRDVRGAERFRQGVHPKVHTPPDASGYRFCANIEGACFRREIGG